MTTELTDAQRRIQNIARPFNSDGWVMCDLNDPFLKDVRKLDGVKYDPLRIVRRIGDIGVMNLLILPFKVAGHIGRKK